MQTVTLPDAKTKTRNFSFAKQKVKEHLESFTDEIEEVVQELLLKSQKTREFEPKTD